MTLEAAVLSAERTARSLRPVWALLTIIGALWSSLEPSGGATQADPPEILAIRQLYAAAREQLKTNAAAETDFHQSDNSWKRGKAGDDDPGDDAAVYRVDGKISVVKMAISSESGDWALAVEYYFRTDGSLAFVFSELRTLYGNVREERRLYFSPAGTRLRETVALSVSHPTSR